MGLPAALGTNVGRNEENNSSSSQQGEQQGQLWVSAGLTEHHKDLLCTGHLPAVAATNLRPLCRLISCGRGAELLPKPLDQPQSLPGEGWQWESSLTPLQPLCCSHPSAQPPGAFSPRKS